jgi:hypothetical protein
MPTEEYKVKKPAQFLPPGGNPTQILMNVSATNAPPTPVAQVKALKDSAHPTGTGEEFEVTPRYARVYLQSNPFADLRTHLLDPSCTVYLRYHSQSVTGNDPIDTFEPIYIY